MKNKILATLLAVCLFAGLAVPAFASTTSTVAGDGSKVTAMQFLKTSYDLKQDDRTNFAKELRVFESTKKLVIDYQQISWTLEGQGTAFTIETDSTGIYVTALEKTGTATLIAKDDQSGKVVAKTTLKAVPNPTKGTALSFKYDNQMNYNIPVGVTADGYAEDFTFKVLPISTGNEWTPANFSDVTAQVKSTVNSALGFDGVTVVPAAADVFTVDLSKFSWGTDAPATTQTVTLTIGGVAVASDALAATDTTTILLAQKFAGKTLTVGGRNYTATAASGSSVVTFTDDTAGASKANINYDIKASMTGTGTGLTVAVKTIKPAIVTTGYDEYTESVSLPAAPNGDNELVFTIPGALLRTLAPDTVKKAVVTKATMSNKDGNSPKEVTAKTNFTFVKAIAAKTIACLPNKTIEVGGTFDLADTVKLGASSANVQRSFGNYQEEYYNENSEANDYAIVNADGSEVLGVAVGKNKISVLLENNQVAYCTVTVVEKGTATPDAGTTTTVLSAWAPKIGVGETANIVVKATKAVTYTSLDTAIATVDAAGKLTAVKEGTAKIKVQEEGKDAVYVSLTVTAKTTTPGGTTDVPQTAVVALAPLF